MYPKIYLAIDNCFASKRWTSPAEWMSVIKNLGVFFVEASADNECDPVYTTRQYLENWIDEISIQSEKTGVRVANLYSGHGSYSTLGLAHPDIRIREHIRENWLNVMIESASILNAGLGFFCHAFNQQFLNNPVQYKEAIKELELNLSYLASYAALKKLKSIGVEQMYTPHQVPWTIKGAEELLRNINHHKNPFYITIDVGHQSGQRKFQKPDYVQLENLCEQPELISGLNGDFWLGTPDAYLMLDKIKNLDVPSERKQILQELYHNINTHEYLFAELQDCDPYQWLSNLGCFSPIVHLQQTDGFSSSHNPFTPEHNHSGIIEGKKVLKAIYDSYNHISQPGMPQKCSEIYLTIEVFSSTSDYPHTILERMKSSVEYWRRFIPEDGLYLNELV